MYALSTCLASPGSCASNRLAFNAMGVVNDPVENAVGQGGVADLLMLA